jgi:hypothetical protein
MVERHDLAQALGFVPIHTQVSPMVEDKLKQAEGFRNRAERLRSIAKDLTREEERKLLMQLASEYEQMAYSAVGLAMAEVVRVSGKTEAR